MATMALMWVAVKRKSIPLPLVQAADGSRRVSVPQIAQIAVQVQVQL